MSQGRAALGRADLVAALVAADDLTADFIGARLGLHREPRPLTHTTAEPRPPPGDTAPPTQAPALAIAPLPPAHFWQPVSVVFLDADAPPTADPPTAPYLGWRNPPRGLPRYQPLATWSELNPRLRRVLSDYREGRAIDLERTLAGLSRGHILTRFPRERRRRWGPTLMLVEDDSRRLIPFRLDRRLVRQALRRLLPAHALGRALVDEGTPVPRPTPESALPWPPPPGTLVLVLGDVGSLAAAGAGLRADWLALGQGLLDAGCHPLVLFPGALERCPADLAARWRPLAWERPRGHDGAADRERAERLLRLVSPAVRIEPGLLRAARLLLAPEAADAATEADVWQHPALVGDSAAGATIAPEQARAWREAVVPPEWVPLRRRLLRLMRAWRRDLPPEIWFDELLNADPAARATGPDTPDLDPLDADLADARGYFQAFCSEVALDRMDALPGNDRDWLERIRVRSTRHLWSDPAVGAALATRADTLVRGRLDAPADSIRVSQLASNRPAESWHLLQRGGELVAAAAQAVGTIGASPVSLIDTSVERLEVRALDERRPVAFWQDAAPPPWADDWGWDDQGAWVEFSVPDPAGSRVVQRLRWIVPDSFLMGSPEDEPGRWEDEGPRHQVTIGDGFWLFDTPCTQALWTAVMGANPSRFQSPGRPVEQVNWEDVRGFLDRLNGLVPGLDLTLPTEAQWEYACRAGTDSALYSGPIEIRGDMDAPALHPIAWYGGNSGVDYDLAEGEDSTTGWWEGKQKQYEHTRAGTREVKGKAPNAWGLYDCLGNVFEWVADHWHDDYSGAPTDGSAWLDAAGAVRVVRGGSWDDFARFCRCAYRSRRAPADRYDFLGFRCARVQVPGGPAGAGGSGAPGSGAARPAERNRPGGTRSGRGADFGGAEPLRLDSAAPAAVTLPDAPAVEVRTERAILTLRRIPRPAWASAMGRDRFGLWAEIAIEPDTGGGQSVIQRLRWCPPGRFLMGSPDDEPERFADEGPRHPVTLRAGYWLFDTPCTQALWEALMGGNPSNFKTPDRPVEMVSWEDAQGFVAALNRRLAGAGAADEHFVLPSESQWEYACRAGSESALYTGPIEILGDANAPALDPIAWYGGNSNVGFELANGQDRSWLKELQYPGGKAGIHPVKGKLPNDWGFYDMLGNVWEWMEDAWHDGYDGAPSDGSAWPSDADADADAAGAYRVVRGGSWNFDARFCRCACRVRNAPADRIDNLGFRCARVQVREPVGPAAERAGPAAARPAVADQAGRRQVRRAEPEQAGLWGRLKSWFGGSEPP